MLVTQPQEPVEEFPDWDDLLASIQKKEVVPIIGKELLRVPLPGPGPLLDHHLARSLADELDVDVTGLPEPAELRHVAFRYLQQRRTPQRSIYSKTRASLERLQLPPPEPLLKLASITDFDLFISTTFDGLLAQAINTVRFNGAARTLDCAFAPVQQVEDLPAEGLQEGGAAVYRLFGRLSTFGGDFAITEEDLLEFLHALQSETRRPRRLFDMLSERHLLFLGCGFPDWLARFFIRTVKAEPFSKQPHRRNEIVVDQRLSQERELVVFLKHFDTQVLHQGGAVQFVDELHHRWQAVRPAGPAPQPQPHERSMPDGSVFLSHAKEDREFVRQACADLEAAGIDAWFDEQDLPPGAHIDHLIQERIRRCSLFIPFISQRTEAVNESYFRKEWLQAIGRSQSIARSISFILPVAVDDTPPAAPNVPPEFGQWRWTKLQEGRLPQEFITHVRDLVRKLRAPQYQAR